MKLPFKSFKTFCSFYNFWVVLSSSFCGISDFILFHSWRRVTRPMFSKKLTFKFSAFVSFSLLNILINLWTVICSCSMYHWAAFQQVNSCLNVWMMRVCSLFFISKDVCWLSKCHWRLIMVCLDDSSIAVYFLHL